MNFYDYINSFRVQKAKELLKSPKYKDQTILSLAFEAGFNSKTTFNTVFKKATGLTPSQFAKKPA
jgi:AraC-like DNA-binding protein